MPAWSQLDQRQRIAVFQCEGGGVRLAARFNDKRKAATSVVAQIPTVRSRKLPADSPLRNSPFLDKTEEFQHSDKLVLDGKKYDYYSYGIVPTDKSLCEVITKVIRPLVPKDHSTWRVFRTLKMWTSWHATRPRSWRKPEHGRSRIG